MYPETVFSASGKLAMAGWTLLVFAPRWRWSQRMASAIIPLALAIVYGCFLISRDHPRWPRHLRTFFEAIAA